MADGQLSVSMTELRFFIRRRALREVLKSCASYVLRLASVPRDISPENAAVDCASVLSLRLSLRPEVVPRPTDISLHYRKTPGW